MTQTSAPKKHEIPEILTVQHNGHRHYLRVFAYGTHDVLVLHPSEEPDISGHEIRELHGGGQPTPLPKHYSFSRVNGRILTSPDGSLSGAMLAPESLIAVHPVTFLADAVKRNAAVRAEKEFVRITSVWGTPGCG